MTSLTPTLLQRCRDRASRLSRCILLLLLLLHRWTTLSKKQRAPPPLPFPVRAFRSLDRDDVTGADLLDSTADVVLTSLSPQLLGFRVQAVDDLSDVLEGV